MRGQIKTFQNRATSVCAACQPSAVFIMGGGKGLEGVQSGGLSAATGGWNRYIEAPHPEVGGFQSTHPSLQSQLGNP